MVGVSLQIQSQASLKFKLNESLGAIRLLNCRKNVSITIYVFLFPDPNDVIKNSSKFSQFLNSLCRIWAKSGHISSITFMKIFCKTYNILSEILKKIAKNFEEKFRKVCKTFFSNFEKKFCESMRKMLENVEKIMRENFRKKFCEVMRKNIGSFRKN